jgi:hypothetical protein
MKISNYAPYAEEGFETARRHPILHPERIIGNSELSRDGFEEVGGISTGLWNASFWLKTQPGRVISLVPSEPKTALR